MATQLWLGEDRRRSSVCRFLVVFCFVWSELNNHGFCQTSCAYNFQVTSDQYLTVRRDGSLHIERVRLDDAGDYTCLAENVVGATNHTTTVNVYGTHTHAITCTKHLY